MTQSTCYKGTKEMKVKGILWHSTGCNNPYLKRYVQPDKDAKDRDAILAKIGTNKNHNSWNEIERQAGLNAWIGKMDDGTVTTIQTMPWNYRPWGCGKGSKGSANNGFIQFEICEDDLDNKEYFDQVYQEACELTAFLCVEYNIDPKGFTECDKVQKCPTIICHQDSYRLGLGNNHSDVLHWFSKHGKTMDDVREDVYNLIYAIQKHSYDKELKDDEKRIWEYLILKIGNPYGVAGLMGNLYAESGLCSTRVQTNKKYSDLIYTEMVDRGNYTNFVKDKIGYGLAQWTYYTRKEQLLNYIKEKKTSIGSLESQLEFLYKELSSKYIKVLDALKNAKTVKEASDIVLTKFEKPKLQSKAVKEKRASYGEIYFNRYGSDYEAKKVLYKVYSGVFKVKRNAEKLQNLLSQENIRGFIIQDDQYYRVQLGVFSNKENAEKLKKDITEKGYSVIIKKE